MEKHGAQLSRYGAIANPVPVAPNAKVFFVASSDSVGCADLQYEFPVDKDGEVRVFTTIDAAIGACTADRGDMIYVMPGHTETVSSASGITLDVAGISIIGLGQGSARPTITLDTAATADIGVSANDITIENCVFVASFADIATVFEIGSATNLTVRNCEFKASAADVNFLTLANTTTTDNAADGLTFEGCKWIEPDTATVSTVDVNGDLDGLTIKNCYMNLGVNTSDLPILAYVATGKDLTNVVITGNMLIRLNDANALMADPDTTTANTGIVANNYIRHADTAGEVFFAASTNIGFFENRATAVGGATGFVLPASDS